MPWVWFRPQLHCRPLTPPRSLGQPLLAQGRGHTATLASELHTATSPCLPGTLLTECLIHPYPHQSIQLPPVLETTLAWAEDREQHGGPPDLGSGPHGFPSRPESGDHPSQLAPSHPGHPVCPWLSPGLSVGIKCPFPASPTNGNRNAGRFQHVAKPLYHHTTPLCPLCHHCLIQTPPPLSRTRRPPSLYPAPSSPPAYICPSKSPCYPPAYSSVALMTLPRKAPFWLSPPKAWRGPGTEGGHEGRHLQDRARPAPPTPLPVQFQGTFTL